MGLRDNLVHWGAVKLLEQPAARLSWQALCQRLEAGGVMIEKRLEAAADTPGNHRTLSHVIGIERWCQSRLRVALGEPFVPGEYDVYRPSARLSWQELIAAFMQTRQATLDLVHSLEKSQGAAGINIRHNQFGELSPQAWLSYMHLHARGEILKIR